jgi:hypothetical protein
MAGVRSNAGSVLDLVLEPRCYLAVPRDRDEMNSVERARLTDVVHHLAGEVDSRVSVCVEGSNEVVWDGQLRGVR